MSKPKHIAPTKLQEIIDHRDNTMLLCCKAYTLTQLSLMDGIDTRTIQHSGRYIPVRVEDARNKYRYSLGNYKKPYRIMRIRMDEVKYQFQKRNKGKQLVIEG